MHLEHMASRAQARAETVEAAMHAEAVAAARSQMRSANDTRTFRLFK